MFRRAVPTRCPMTWRFACGTLKRRPQILHDHSLAELNNQAAQLTRVVVVNGESPKILNRSRLGWLQTLQRLHKQRKPLQSLMHTREDTKNRKEHAKQGY
jgi:hypothetical protein